MSNEAGRVSTEDPSLRSGEFGIHIVVKAEPLKGGRRGVVGSDLHLMRLALMVVWPKDERTK